MNYFHLFIVIVVSVIYGSGSVTTVSGTAVPIHTTVPMMDSPTPQTILALWYYDSPDCSGEPIEIVNITIGECNNAIGVSYYPSNDGQYVYNFYTMDHHCDEAPPTYSEIIRYDTLPIIHDPFCYQYVITNPEYAPSLPLEFPPAGWMVDIEYLNSTTGEPARDSNCVSTRVNLIAVNNACMNGVQPFCDGENQVEAAFYYYPNDLQCQGEPMKVESRLLPGCQDGFVQFVCPSGNTIPPIPSQLSINQTVYGGPSCGDYDNNTIINLTPDTCVSYPNTNVSYRYHCDPINDRIIVTTYSDNICYAGGSSVDYQLGACSVLGEDQYFSYECSPTPPTPLPATTLATYYYSNSDCSGQPTQITNLTVGECLNGVSYYPSNDGQYVYVYAFPSSDYQCNQSSPVVYWYIIRYDTLPIVDEGRCQQFVVMNPNNAPIPPLAFPPVGWWQEIAYLNATGQPASTCAGPRSTIYAHDPSVCQRGLQAFCDGATQVGAEFMYAIGDDQCQGVPQEVAQESLEGCFDGSFMQICPSGNTIPSIPSALSVTLINYGGTTCGDYDNNTIINAVEGVCISQFNHPTFIIYDCDIPNDRITVTTYQRSDCSDVGSSIGYQLGTCEFNQKNQYFTYDCNTTATAKPTRELLSETVRTPTILTTATATAASTSLNLAPQPATLSQKKRSKKKIILH